MDTNVLKTFIAVCEYSGFSAAAKELGYTQSTVSSQIKQLEKELDVRLFDRYYHKINLTEKGVLVLQQARNILKAQAKMLDSLNSAESIEGEIRLSMSSSVCSRYFKNDFLRFHHQYPEIKVEITENGTEQMFDKLRKNETDLVFTLDRHIYDSDFIICAEQEEQVHFIVAADNPVAGCSWKLSEISQNEFVLTEQAMSYRKILNETLASQSLEIRPVLEIGNPLQICELVKNSSLLSFLPDLSFAQFIHLHGLYVIQGKACVACSLCFQVISALEPHVIKGRNRLSSFSRHIYRALSGRKTHGCPAYRGVGCRRKHISCQQTAGHRKSSPASYQISPALSHIPSPFQYLIRLLTL